MNELRRLATLESMETDLEFLQGMREELADDFSQKDEYDLVTHLANCRMVFGNVLKLVRAGNYNVGDVGARMQEKEFNERRESALELLKPYLPDDDEEGLVSFEEEPKTNEDLKFDFGCLEDTLASLRNEMPPEEFEQVAGYVEKASMALTHLLGGTEIVRWQKEFDTANELAFDQMRPYMPNVPDSE